VTDDNATDALEQALALHSMPARASMLRRRPLPGNVLTLIRIVSGDAECIATAASRTGEIPATVVDAARLYIQRVMFDDSADSYRMLGVQADAADALIKLHYRSLVRWLHPDRNPERWEVAYTERVNRAWHSLNTPERRARYDGEIRALAESSRERDASDRRQHRIERAIGHHESNSVLSPRSIRWIPTIVLGSLAAASALVLIALNWVPNHQPPVQPDTAAASGAPVVTAQSATHFQPQIQNAAGSTFTVANADGPQESVGQGLATTTQSTSPGPAAAAMSGKDLPQSGSPPVAMTDAGRAGSGLPIDASEDMDAEIAAVRQSVEHPADEQGTLAGPPREGGDPSILADHAARLPRPSSGPRRVGLRPGLDAVTLPRDNQGHGVPASSETTSKKTSVRTADRVSPASASSEPPGAQLAPPLPNSGEANPPAHSAVVVAAQTPASTPESMSPQDGAVFITHAFESAYDAGNLQQLLHLFTPTAVNDRGGMDAITEDYSQFFHESKARTLDLHHVAWVYEPDRIIGTASFDARIVGTNDPTPHTVKGWMRIEAVPSGALWKIQSLRHGNSQ
jgi:hypothetical protein